MLFKLVFNVSPSWQQRVFRGKCMVTKALAQKTRKSIIKLSPGKVREFFLRNESYFNMDLPPYFNFSAILSCVDKSLNGKNISDLIKNPRYYDNVNYTFFANKDGKYSWRPFQLIHPVLYIALVDIITEADNWKYLQEIFKEFSKNKKITCLSIPVVSLSAQTDKAEQVSQWWQDVEQKSIELSLIWECLIKTDITDCYSAIYTHSIAWALHTKKTAKTKRKDKSLLGNQLDSIIQDMRNGQTNGIPQGPVIMDFIAEIVLGYADTQLSKKIEEEGIKNYQVLRYRDDYRIFTNNPRSGEKIVKLLTEVLIDLGLRGHPACSLQCPGEPSPYEYGASKLDHSEVIA